MSIISLYWYNMRYTHPYLYPSRLCVCSLTCSYVRSRMRIHTLMYMHAYTCTNTHAHTPITCKHTHEHIHTHTHTHTHQRHVYITPLLLADSLVSGVHVHVHDVHVCQFVHVTFGQSHLNSVLKIVFYISDWPNALSIVLLLEFSREFHMMSLSR